MGKINLRFDLIRDFWALKIRLEPSAIRFESKRLKFDLIGIWIVLAWGLNFMRYVLKSCFAHHV